VNKALWALTQMCHGWLEGISGKKSSELRTKIGGLFCGIWE
jgi:hypothetical protein